MKVVAIALSLVASSQAFSVPSSTRFARASVIGHGYLDDLRSELYQEVDNPDTEGVDRESTKAKAEDIENFGVGSWEGFVDFEDEFDGGDGQMGVAGDGNKKLEEFDTTQLVKSRTMSAKNAWGTSTGYAEELKAKGMDTARAQQIENWRNQREVRKKIEDQIAMTESFDEDKEEEDWRTLAKFGVERNQDFDLDEEFGAVEVGGTAEGEISLSARMGGAAGIHEFELCNEYMGFADFRAAFVGGPDFSVDPSEGSLSKSPTEFVVKFRPSAPGEQQAYLVIETEDFKKTWKVTGTTA